MNENMLCNNLLVGISGSLHALHIYHYLNLFQESLTSNIKVIMTINATHMVDPKTLELFVGEEIFIDPWDQQTSALSKVPHIELTRWADLFVIIPTTANILGKAAHGIADDLLSTAILSYTRSVVFVPTMNSSMWRSKALQHNIKILKENGHYIVPPDTTGLALATGEQDAISSTPEKVLRHLRHVRMKELRNEYWKEATREKPLTPLEKKARDIAQRKAERLQKQR